MKSKILLLVVIGILMACSSTELCKRYDYYYFTHHGISSNCSGDLEGMGRNKIFKNYMNRLNTIDSSLIVIEQINYSLATNFASMEIIFIKDFKFDKQYEYALNENRRNEIKDISSNYGQTLGRPNYKTVNMILDKIINEGLNGVSKLVKKNDGGIEGNTTVTLYNNNLDIIEGIRLKRQLRFVEELPPIPKAP